MGLTNNTGADTVVEAVGVPATLELVVTFTTESKSPPLSL